MTDPTTATASILAATWKVIALLLKLRLKSVLGWQDRWDPTYLACSVPTIGHNTQERRWQAEICLQEGLPKREYRSNKQCTGPKLKTLSMPKNQIIYKLPDQSAVNYILLPPEPSRSLRFV